MKFQGRNGGKKWTTGFIGKVKTTTPHRHTTHFSSFSAYVFVWRLARQSVNSIKNTLKSFQTFAQTRN
jgi:hypothetical protein